MKIEIDHSSGGALGGIEWSLKRDGNRGRRTGER